MLRTIQYVVFFLFLWKIITRKLLVMFRNLNPFLVALACLIISSKSQAQIIRHIIIDPYRSRFDEIGFVTGYTTPTCEAFHFAPDDNGTVREKKVWGKAPGYFNYGGSVGAGLHIAKLSDKSSIALNLTVMGTYSKLNITNENIPIEKGFIFNQEVEMIRAFVSFGVDYKIGAEAMSDKTLKTMYTVGGGVIPQFEMISGASGISPYIKADAGYYLGFAMKIRAMYIIGEQNLYKSDFTVPVKNNPAPNQPRQDKPYFQLTSGGSFLLSFIIMPFSYTWEDY